MAEKRHKVTVEILGQTYTLKGDADPEKIAKIAALVDQRMKKIFQANPQLSPVKIAVLAALNIAEEHMQLKQDYRQLIQMINQEK